MRKSIVSAGSAVGTLALIVSMTANAAATPLPSAGIQSALDAYTAGFPGAAVAVAIVDGDATSAYFSGNLGNGRKLDDRTLFQIGSVTKTFTATLFA